MRVWSGEIDGHQSLSLSLSVERLIEGVVDKLLTLIPSLPFSLQHHTINIYTPPADQQLAAFLYFQSHGQEGL
jgi:hypothetical protein